MKYPQMEEQYGIGIYPSRDITLVSGSDAIVWDDEGREYIDCTAGIGVASVGHCNSEVVKAIQRQAARMITCAGIFANDVRAQCMETLASVAPPGLNRVFLCNSGAESIEAAIKLARQSTGRHEIASAYLGFHGRTFGALSATHRKSYQEPFQPLVPGFKGFSFNKIKSLDKVLDDDTAALILELVQGEGGVRPARQEFVSEAAKMCHERGVLLVIDEIQTGFCRTGTMFACEQYGVAPDILCLAKAMAGGFPMGATVVNEKIRSKIGSHGSTFGGNPLACAASVATIEYMQREKLAKRAAELGSSFVQQLKQYEIPLIRDIRQLGLMIGIELRVRSTPYLKQLQERRILALPAGSTVIRLLPPLVIAEHQMDQVLNELVSILTAKD